MFDFLSNFFYALDEPVTAITECLENIYDGSQEADDMPRVIAEADKIIQRAEQIKILAQERAKHPDVESEYELSFTVDVSVPKRPKS